MSARQNLERGEFGPKMRALRTPRQRKFVLALLDQGNRNYTAAYQLAGYGGRSQGADRVNARHLAHDSHIQEALQEEAGRRLKGLLPLALHVAEDIMANGTRDADRAKIALGMLDRAGLQIVSEHRVTVNLISDAETLARIKLLAQRNGLPIEHLLGERHSRMIDITPVTEVEVANIEPKP